MSSEHAQPAEPVMPNATRRRGLRFTGITAVALALAVVVIGVTTRKMADARLRDWTEAQAVPSVAVVLPDTRSNRATVDLPGRLEAYSQAQIYSRVAGYLREWKADIGSPVKAGELLAEIDAPELDQEIMQAEAGVASATANAALASATLQRGEALSKSGAVSKQDLDQRAADAANKAGLVKSAQANLDRLRVLEKYKRIVAPFDGLVTARSTDVGALINAGGGGGSPLFVVSDISKLRVYVNVPQNYVPNIKIGTKARITLPEYPGRNFSAIVQASARAVDIASSTTRMQLIVDNASDELLTGAFANVELELPSPEVAISVPASALIFDQGGLRVATVGPDNRVILKPITIARDFGKVIEVATGLNPDDRVVESPPDAIAQGDFVRIVGDPIKPARDQRIPADHEAATERAPSIKPPG
jgi:RND family efflux transporter MFP subunit